MINKNCEYFPCHKELEDCQFCYCPIYPCEYSEFGGKWVKNNKNEKIWDCSDCVVFHKKKVVDFINEEKRKNYCEYI